MHHLHIHRDNLIIKKITVLFKLKKLLRKVDTVLQICESPECLALWKTAGFSASPVNLLVHHKSDNL